MRDTTLGSAGVPRPGARSGWGRFACAAVLASISSQPLAGQAPEAPSLDVVKAARATIAAQPEILLQQQRLASSRGALQTASGQFDPQLSASLLRARDTLPFTDAQIEQTDQLYDAATTNTTAYRLGLEKVFRTGLTISPLLEVVREDVNVLGAATNRAGVAFQVTQPLLRGRGRDVVTAQETAARLEVEATTLDLRQVIASSVVRTVQAYWGYLAAVRALDVLRKAEDRARTLVDQIQTMIRADVRPAADLKQSQANLADRVSQRAAAEQALFEARQRLGIAMGLPFDQIGALPLPGDTFPDIEATQVASAATFGGMVDQAMAYRSDLQALRTRQREADVLRAQARDGLRPELNLGGSAGYAGLDEGRAFWQLFTPLAPQGFNASASLLFSWPVLNNTARGLFSQSEATYQQTSLEADDLARTISARVTVAADAVRQSAVRAHSAREASSLYRAAVSDEWQKLQIGLSTMLDVILIEDRLTQSLLSEVEAELSYALAVAQLRFETGTLIGDLRGVSDPTLLVDRERITQVPTGGS